MWCRHKYRTQYVITKHLWIIFLVLHRNFNQSLLTTKRFNLSNKDLNLSISNNINYIIILFTSLFLLLLLKTNLYFIIFFFYFLVYILTHFFTYLYLIFTKFYFPKPSKFPHFYFFTVIIHNNVAPVILYLYIKLKNFVL